MVIGSFSRHNRGARPNADVDVNVDINTLTMTGRVINATIPSPNNNYMVSNYAVQRKPAEWEFRFVINRASAINIGQLTLGNNNDPY